MENVVFDGRNISQRRYQNRTFPNRVHKKIIFRKMSKNGGEGGRVGGCDLGGKLHFVRAHRRRNAPRAYTKGIEVPRYHVESRTP